MKLKAQQNLTYTDIHVKDNLYIKTKQNNKNTKTIWLTATELWVHGLRHEQDMKARVEEEVEEDKPQIR